MTDGRRILWGAVATTLVVALDGTPAIAQAKYPAVLAGHAVLPALTFVEAPPDAPASLCTSGRFAAPGGRRGLP